MSLAWTCRGTFSSLCKKSKKISADELVYLFVILLGVAFIVNEVAWLLSVLTTN